MKKFFICLFSSVLFVASNAFEFNKWQKNFLDIAEYKDGVLHLARTKKAEKSASLVYRFSKPEIKQYIGRQLVFSAEMEQLDASRGDSVGLAVYGKTKDGKPFSVSGRLPFRGKHAPVQMKVSFDVPENVFTLYARFDAPGGWNRTADVLFRNIKIESLPADTEKWNCGIGSFFCVGNKPLFWNWKTTPGLKAELKNNVFYLEGKGTLTLRHQPGMPYILDGSTPDYAALTFSLGTVTPVTIDITSYNKKNNTVKLDKITPSKNGTINIKIPLSRFAQFHDLVRFEEISFSVDGKQSIRKCCITDLDMAGNAKNILFDPSFEKAETPESNFNLWGDYRSEYLVRGAKFSTAEKFHGKRSLEIAPGGFTTLQASDANGRSTVFSLYAKGGKFEVGLQQQMFKIHGSGGMYSWKKEFTASDKWSRFVFESPLKLASAAGRQLYIVKIRNTGTVPLFIDAVQLELNSGKATDFKPERRTAFKTNLKYVLPVTLPPEPENTPDDKVSGRVKITAVNPDNRDYSSIPVRGGVTFAKGELFKPDSFKVTDADGKTVPAQFTVLARRHIDKSIMSVAVNFNTALKASERKDFYLEYGKKYSASAEKNIAKMQGRNIAINTGRLALTLTPYENSFIRGCDAYCAVQDVDGKIYRSKADIMRIDENGPLQATVFMRGKSLLAWELRLTFYKDMPFMSAEYSFENNFSETDTFSRCVRSIFIELPGGKSYKTDGFSGKGNALFVQRHARSGEFMWDAYVKRDGKTAVQEHLKLSGSGKAGKAAFRIFDFAELAPRAIGFTDEKVRFYHYPPEGTALLDMPAGFSSTMRFNYAFDAADVPESTNAILYTDPVHTNKSGVFDSHLSYNDMRKYFPKSARDMEQILDGIRKSTDVRAFYGLCDFGDWGSRNYYCNHETAGVRSLWTWYLVTGNVQDFKNACAHAYHQRDIDQNHIRYGTAGVHTHNGCNNQSYSYHTGHFWLTGIINHYMLTGDRRSYESAVSAMAALIEKSGLKYPRGRERHRMLYHLAEVYEFTGLPILKEAFERQYNVGGASDSSAYYGAISYEALEKLYEVTGEARYLERLNREVREFEKANRVNFKPMPEDRGMPTTQSGTADSGRGVMTVFSGSRAAMRYNDSKLINFLDIGTAHDPVLSKLLDPRARSANLAWLFGAFDAMKHFGIKEHADTPDSYNFIYLLTGLQRLCDNYVPFVFESVPDKDNMCVIDIYRYRMFRYWNKKLDGDYVYCKVFSSDGKLLKNEVVNGNVTNEHKRLKVKSPDGKPLKIELIFASDSWGSVSSPGKLRLSSDRVFGARNSSDIPLMMYIKAPFSGKLEIPWTWAWKNNISAGEILSACLETCGGKNVVSSVYTIPEDMPVAECSKHTLKLDIPPQYRGKILKLYMNVPKWITWRINGLDYPWLGNTAEDIQ